MVAWRLRTGWRIVPGAVKLRLGLQDRPGRLTAWRRACCLSRGRLMPGPWSWCLCWASGGLLGYALRCLLPDP